MDVTEEFQENHKAVLFKTFSFVTIKIISSFLYTVYAPLSKFHYLINKEK